MFLERTRSERHIYFQIIYKDEYHFSYFRVIVPVMTLMYQLFRNNSFALNNMFQQNASKFATFNVHK